ncbi:3-beta hydroxysteroid dehydrogenase/isomerase family protein [Gracilibacillus ureilyticus]|uniref:3-beta hydroxysteroid dehydrogenase/isomerase family protein n=1 Tax=Gracilibacillus ureilyticus TaxID=531814 RepID=A0A1H9VRL0_9BACI|nr:saccharopine dehydrogenase NADP-binding domain-containing protein [Gracilibacillus ureilyticus]SES24198.1 3-beta hydroxysteroid dehydrogenase/isomerase family protein [Gracilibacillus ureilyticus]
MTRVMVVGAGGKLGKIICNEVLRSCTPAELIVTDYKKLRGKELIQSLPGQVEFHLLDIYNRKNVEEVIQDIDIVIVCVKQVHPHVQEICIRRQILCIDVTPFGKLVDCIYDLEHKAKARKACSIVMAGFIPGLSGMLVKKAIIPFDEIDEVNVSFLQSSNANAGITGAIDMLQLISQPVTYGTRTVRGFKEKGKVPHTQNTVRLISHPEKDYLANKLAIPAINYWTAWNDKLFNLKVAVLLTTNLLPLLKKHRALFEKQIKHDPSLKEDVSITVEVRGTISNQTIKRGYCLTAFSDYEMTAMVTVALAKIIHNKKVSGVYFPFEVAAFDEIIAEISHERVNLVELT